MFRSYKKLWQKEVDLNAQLAKQIQDLQAKHSRELKAKDDLIRMIEKEKNDTVAAIREHTAKEKEAIKTQEAKNYATKLEELIKK